MKSLLSPIVEIARRTPHDQGAPVINGPSVFGVSPNKPCLFTFPVCGEAPLKFEVIGNLPEGINLNQTNGRLSGKCPTEGKYTFTVKVSNALGAAEKEFTLCVEKDKLCLTPLLGWTSWNAFTNTAALNQETIRNTAGLLVKTGLAARGYAYVNIDSSWQGKRNKETKALMANDRFPDMKALVDHIHSLGLKAGIYSTPMALAWGLTEYEYLMGSYGFPLDPKYFHPYHGGCGSVSYVQYDVPQWAAWEFDYLKYDWSPITDPEHAEEMGKALRESDRDFVLSLCTRCQLKEIERYKACAHMYRNNNDTNDNWELIAGNAFTVDEWAEHIEPGAWFDMDMLALGDIQINGGVPNRLTRDDQITHVAAWALFPSPIQISCDLSKIDDFILDLLSNEEILAVNQDYPAKGAVCVRNIEERSPDRKVTGSERIYRRELSDGRVVFGFFNTGDFERTITYGLGAEYNLRDLWARRDLGKAREVTMVIPPHGSRIIAASNI